MKKLNNKGFMLVEILVVSVFIATVLVVMFAQFKKINKSYNISFNYNTVEGLYLLDNVKKIAPTINQNSFSDNNKYFALYSPLCISEGIYYSCQMLKEMKVKIIYVARKDAREAMLKDPDISIEFKDYIKYMSFKAYNTEYFLIAEFKDGTYASINI